MLYTAAAALGVLLLIGGIAALIIIRPFSRGRESEADNVSPAPAFTPLPTDAPASGSPMPDPTAAATEAPTEAPSEAPTEAPADPTSVPTPSAPVRISDDLSSALVWIEIGIKYDAEGAPYAVMKGSMSLEMVNNTDSVLFGAQLVSGGLNVDSVTINGFAVNYSVSDGMLTIPFFNELQQASSCSVFIEFSCKTDMDGEIRLPELGYDSPYLLTAHIRSDVVLSASGADFELTDASVPFTYSIEDASVRSVALKLEG